MISLHLDARRELAEPALGQAERNRAARKIAGQQAARRRNHGGSHSYKNALLEGALHSPEPASSFIRNPSKIPLTKNRHTLLHREKWGFLYRILNNSSQTAREIP
jgi:hypothetical protein